MVRVLFSITITVWLPSLGPPLKKNLNTLISIPSHICFLCTWTLISQLEWSIKSDLVSHNVTGLLCKGNPVKSRSSQICTYFPIIKRSSLHRNWHHLKCSWFLFTEKMTMSTVTLDLFARGGGLNCWPLPWKFLPILSSKCTWSIHLDTYHDCVPWVLVWKETQGLK